MKKVFLTLACCLTVFLLAIGRGYCQYIGQTVSGDCTAYFNSIVGKDGKIVADPTKVNDVISRFCVWSDSTGIPQTLTERSNLRMNILYYEYTPKVGPPGDAPTYTVRDVPVDYFEKTVNSTGIYTENKTLLCVFPARPAVISNAHSGAWVCAYYYYKNNIELRSDVISTPVWTQVTSGYGLHTKDGYYSHVKNPLRVKARKRIPDMIAR